MVDKLRKMVVIRKRIPHLKIESNIDVKKFIAASEEIPMKGNIAFAWGEIGKLSPLTPDAALKVLYKRTKKKRPQSMISIYMKNGDQLGLLLLNGNHLSFVGKDHLEQKKVPLQNLRIWGRNALA